MGQKKAQNQKLYKNEFQNGRRLVVYHCSDPCGGMPWHKTYVKEKYDPGSIEKIQYWIWSHLPKSIYAIILKYSARWAMVKMVKKYRMYQKCKWI